KSPNREPCGGKNLRGEGTKRMKPKRRGTRVGAPKRGEPGRDVPDRRKCKHDKAQHRRDCSGGCQSHDVLPGCIDGKAPSLRSEPVERVLALEEPGGRKNGRTFKRLLAAGFDCAGETGRYVKGKFSRASRAIARDDAIVAPLHDARAELVTKLGGIDQQELRAHLLGFPGEQCQRGLECTVCHLARQPSQLQDAVALVMNDLSPTVACQRGRHRSSLLQSAARGRGAVARKRILA